MTCTTWAAGTYPLPRRRGRPRHPESFACRVEALVAQHGPATCDDIVRLAPDITRKQATSALIFLNKAQRLYIYKRGAHLGYLKGEAPSVYARERND